MCSILQDTTTYLRKEWWLLKDVRYNFSCSESVSRKKEIYQILSFSSDLCVDVRFGALSGCSIIFGDQLIFGMVILDPKASSNGVYCSKTDFSGSKKPFTSARILFHEYETLSAGIEYPIRSVYPWINWKTTSSPKHASDFRNQRWFPKFPETSGVSGNFEFSGIEW